MDSSYQLLAASYFRRQAKQLADQLAGVRKAEDLEYVHQLRVTTRRADAALQLFRDCMPSRRAKKMRRRLSQIRKAAGME